MSGFFGRNSKADTGQTKLSGIKVQTTVLGRCIPWVFGTNRVAPNIVQHDDFRAIEKKEKQGGKGGGGTSTSYDYQAAVILAICRGPIAGIGQIWADKKKHTPASLALDVYLGSDTQTPHPHWSTNHPTKAMAYRGLAYAAKAVMDLGAGGSVERHTFEVKASTRISDANPDARVSDVITAIVTDRLDGIGLPATRLGDLSALDSFCGANGIFVSPAYEDQRAAKDVLVRLAEIAQCGMFWGDGKLQFVPFSDAAASGNGYTYTPSIEAIPELTTDDFLPQGDRPAIQIKRKGAANAKNHYQVKYSDRASEYNAATVESKDLGSIERFGTLSAEPDEFPEICTGATAQKLADFRRDRSSAVRTTYTFKLSLRWDRLGPMDIVALTHAPDDLAQHTVRITSVEESDDELLIEAEDCPLGAQYVVTRAAQSLLGTGVDYNASPGSIDTPVIFEAPVELTGTGLEVYVAVRGSTPAWGGCSVWVSWDGDSYYRVGQVTGPSRYGALSAPSAAGAATLSVGGLGSAQLGDGSAADAETLQTLVYVGGANPEYLAYETATLTGVGAYALGGLVHGVYRSRAAAHAIGDAFVRVDDRLVKSGDLPIDYIGRVMRFKFTSYNVYGGGEQSLADVPEIPYTITGVMTRLPPPAITSVHVLQGSGGSRQIRWTYPPAIPHVKQHEARYWSGSVLPSWDAMNTIFTAGVGERSRESMLPPDGEHYISMLAVDVWGNVSDRTTVQVTLSGDPGTIVNSTAPHSTGWPGDRVSCYPEGSYLVPGVSTSGAWDDPGPWDEPGTWDGTVLPSTSMSYAQTVDMATVAPRYVRVQHDSTGMTAVELCTSPDGVNWTAWMPITTASVAARYYQTRISLAGASAELRTMTINLYL